MSNLPKAQVRWRRFGQVHSGLFGERFEDAGERLAVITCPLCGAPRASEYAEYMQMLRLPAIRCRACRGEYTLRWSSARNAPASNPAPESQPQAPPDPERDEWGRRDWGTV